MAVLCGREKEYHKEFRALLALIKGDDAAALRQRFKAAFLDYTDRILKIYDRLQPVNQQPLPYFRTGLPRLERVLDEDIPPSQRPEVIALLMGTELICRPAAEIQNLLHSRKAAELLSSYGTDDPYALCAAYLLLEHEKDALVNLNNLTAVVMICAGKHLPWGAMYAYYTDAGGYGWKEVDWSLDDEEGEEEVPPTKDEETPPVTLPADDHAAQIESLTRKVKELRSALHDAERAAGHMREQLQDMEQKGEAERAELVQLRETLYQLRAGNHDEAADSGPLVELPWQVKRRVAVFGGHDSWCKAVKPLLPGVRFYGREELPDLNIVRGADVVWLQVNALSHKYYYRIIDAARKNSIPVRYFGSASAKRCAVQLAMDELAEKKKTM